MEYDMDENKQQEQQQEQGGSGNAFEPITSQEQLDKIIAARLKRAESKTRKQVEDEFAPVKADADKLADVEARASKLEAELTEMKANAARAAAVAEVAKATGLPADVVANLTGSTVDELTAAAAPLSAFMKSQPIYPEVNKNNSGGAKPVTREDIMSIKNPAERRKAIAENMNLWD